MRLRCGVTEQGLADRVQEVDPYAFLHEVSEELPPPANSDDPEAWLAQYGSILDAVEEFDNPALELMGELAEEEWRNETDDVSEMLEHEAYLVGLNASIAQTYYWRESLCLEKLDGYCEAADDETAEEIDELRRPHEQAAFENSFRMWKSGLTHLMYMNHDPFLTESGFNYLDYHDKMHVSFVILTATTLVETALGRVLVDMGRDDAPDKDLNDRINMTVARTELTEDDKDTLHALRRARNLVAHDISQRTNYRAPDEIEGLENHFDATFGVTIRSLNVASRVLEEVYGFSEPFDRFHKDTEKMVESIITHLDSD